MTDHCWETGREVVVSSGITLSAGVKVPAPGSRTPTAPGTIAGFSDQLPQ
ncbi:hypothetical protein [Actinoallomurus liliacearum]